MVNVNEIKPIVWLKLAVVAFALLILVYLIREQVTEFLLNIFGGHVWQVVLFLIVIVFLVGGANAVKRLVKR